MALDKAFYRKYGFNLSNALGSGCVVMCITGGRSTGKTYTAKRQAIKEFVEKGWQFAYVRYYDEEIKRISGKADPRAWFADIMKNNEFPGWDFKLNGREFQARRSEDEKWQTMGQLFSLTAAQSYKGDVAPNCHLMIFDEFIREKRGAPYPPDAVGALLGLWETLDRKQDRVRILMLANAADIVNPFYSEWHIVPPEPGQHKRVKVGNLYVYVEHARNAEFDAAARETNIGMMTAGSAYGAYSIENSWANDNKAFVSEKPRRCRPQANIMWDGRWFSVWMDLEAMGMLWIQGKKAADAGLEFCLFADDLTPSLPMIERSSPFLKKIAKWFRAGYVWFDSGQTRARFLNILQLCGIR